MTRTLSEVESAMAEVANERRYAARLTAAGLAVFIGADAIRQYPNRSRPSTTTVLPFTVYAGQRAAVIVCEVSGQELIEFVLGLVDGEVVRLSGQLVGSSGRFGSRLRLRVSSIERCEMRHTAAR